MLKKLWESYSYSIVFVIIVLLVLLMLTSRVGNEDMDRYTSITINKGDTIWELSEEYAGKYSMTREQFIKWVEKHNGITANQLVLGQELIIPVHVEELELQLAAD